MQNGKRQRRSKYLSVLHPVNHYGYIRARPKKQENKQGRNISSRERLLMRVYCLLGFRFIKKGTKQTKFNVNSK